MTDPKAISVQNLTVEYRRALGRPLHAVNGLSFDVREGEIVGFLGLNGAGKTSTLKALMGFQPTSGGEARVFGLPAGSVGSRRRIGFLPETATYSPHLTPLETLRFYGELHGLAGRALAARIEVLLRTVGLEEKARTRNGKLSKGMLQRVGIAQALLGEPSLLILDELSSGLDPVGRRDLRALLQAQREKGVTVFFSSHELSEVELICDRILILHRGRLLAERDAEQVRREAASLEDYFVAMVRREPARIEEAA